MANGLVDCHWAVTVRKQRPRLRWLLLVGNCQAIGSRGFHL
jgi:hypothetical protein